MQVLSTTAPHGDRTSVVAVFKQGIIIYIYNMPHIHIWMCTQFFLGISTFKFQTVLKMDVID